MDDHTLNCGHDHCGTCCGGGCHGCGGELELTQPEIDLLRLFAQIPYLPVARRAESDNPVFFENSIAPAETLGAAVAALSQKGLIQVDYELPLKNYDYAQYRSYPRKGSMALTARGQTAVELLEIQGIEA